MHLIADFVIFILKVAFYVILNLGNWLNLSD